MVDPRDVEILPPDPDWHPREEHVRVYDVVEVPGSVEPAGVQAVPQRPTPKGDPGIVARWAKWALRLYLLAVASVLVVWLFEPFGPNLLQRLTETLATMGVWGKLLVVAGVAVGCPLFMPVGPLAVIPGYIYGSVEGTVLAIAGASLGGLVNFYLSRMYLEPHVHAWLSRNPVPARLYRTLDARGARIGMGLRMTPIMHYGVLCFLCGLTTLRWWQFVPAMALGGIPWTSVWANVGDMLHQALEPVSLDALGRSPHAWTLRWVGLGVMVVLAVWVGRLAKRDLARAAAEVGQ